MPGGLRLAADLEAEGDVVEDPPVGQQPEVLEDHREPPPAQLAEPLRARLADVLAVEQRPRRAVGSISRVRQRTSVDLPLPDRPMTTKTSPGRTSNETSRTAIVAALGRDGRVDGLGVRRLAGALGDLRLRRPEDLPEVADGRARRLSRSGFGSRHGRADPSVRSAVAARSVTLRTSLSDPVPCSARCAWPHGTRPDRSGQVPGRCPTA